MKLRNLLLIGLFALTLGCSSADDVRNDKPRTAEDEAYIQDLDNQIDDAEQGDGQ